MLLNLVFNLEIELEYAVHCKGDAKAFEYLDPDVCKGRIQGVLAVSSSSLTDEGDEGEEDSDEAVLEYADPYHLQCG